MIATVHGLYREVQRFSRFVGQHLPALVLATFAAELASPRIGPGLGEREVTRVGAGEIGGKFPIDLGIATRIRLVPVRGLALAMVDVVKRPEGRAGAELRCDLRPNLVSA